MTHRCAYTTAVARISRQFPLHTFGISQTQTLQKLSVSVSIPKPELQADSAQLTLEPGASIACNLAFAPHAIGKFHCPVCFEVNGIFKTSAEVVADVIPRRLEVVSNTHRTVDLGALRTGKSRKFSIEVVNKALLNAEINLEPSKELARRLGLHLHIDKLQLAAREKSILTITYKPKSRLTPFYEAIHVMVSGVVLPLLRVKGSALGLEASLSAETLPFGNVMLGSSTTKALQLHNPGEIYLYCHSLCSTAQLQLNTCHDNLRRCR